eukprot:Skav229888  [mRNA]  locus=scaffold247:503076:505923:- [translate_table: standard]
MFFKKEQVPPAAQEDEAPKEEVAAAEAPKGPEGYHGGHSIESQAALKKMVADLKIELDEERRLKGCLENELDAMKKKKVEWQRLAQGTQEELRRWPCEEA